MTYDLTRLRAEAESLASALPGASLSVRAASATHSGSAGRKRAGTGEDFWQYRQHSTEDGSARVDWRRSARGDTLFVRETELETARTLYIWADPSKGFDWASASGPVTKADRARILMLALASHLSRDGERIGVLGGQKPGFGGKSVERAGEDLLRLKNGHKDLPVPRSRGLVIVASDFYDPKTEWLSRLKPLAARCPDGVLLSISDPAEHAFAYSGRVEFEIPGADERLLIERAEAIRARYLEKLRQHEAELDQLSRTLGWPLVRHVTRESPLQAAVSLLSLLEQLGERAKRSAS